MLYPTNNRLKLPNRISTSLLVVTIVLISITSSHLALTPSLIDNTHSESSQQYHLHIDSKRKSPRIRPRIQEQENQDNLFLVQNQKIMIIPEQIFEQTPYTQYSISGTNYSEQEALSVIKRYQQPIKELPSYNSSQFQPLAIDVISTVIDIQLMHFINSSKILIFSILEYQQIKLIASANLSSYLIIPKGLKSITDRTCLIWGIFEVIFAAQDLQQQQKNSQIVNITASSVSLQVELSGKSLKSCTIYNDSEFVCFSLDKIFMMKIVQNQLYIYHVFEVTHKCLVNVIQIQENIVALCDCTDGCYNYEIVNGKLEEKAHVIVHFDEKISSMEIYENHAEATILVGLSSVIVLYQWNPISIIFSDSFLIPTLPYTLERITANTNSILLSYSSIDSLVHILLKSDSLSKIYFPVNKIFSNNFMKLSNNRLYEITLDSKLQVRALNPYNIKFQYSQSPREMTLRAFENNSSGQLQEFTYMVVPANFNSIYINKELPHNIQITNDQSYEIDLGGLFVWSKMNNFSVLVRSKTSSSDYQDPFLINMTKDHRVLSLYNLLPCIKMEPEDQTSFKRVMLGPKNKLYIEVCGDENIFNDFLCKLSSIQENVIGEMLEDELQSKYRLLQMKGHTYLWVFDEDKTSSTYHYIINHEGFCHSLELPLVTGFHEEIRLLNERFLAYLLLTDAASLKYSIVVYDIVKDMAITEQILGDIGGLFIDIEKMQLSLALKQQTSSLIYIFNLYSLLPHSHPVPLLKSLYFLNQTPSRSTPITRFFQDYYVVTNQTHFCKYSAFTSNMELLFCLEFENTDALIKGKSSNRYFLIIYEESYRIMDLLASKLSCELSYLEQSNAASTVYDLMLLNETYIIMGIGNIVRSLMLQPQVEIGHFVGRTDLMRDILQVQINPVPQATYPIIPVQNIELTIIFRSKSLEYQGKRVKLLSVPYSAQNYQLQIYETMFKGPIFSYSVFETYDKKIIITNHFQGKNQTNGTIENNEIIDELYFFNYSLLIGDPIVENKELVYTNLTHVAIRNSEGEWDKLMIEAEQTGSKARFLYVHSIMMSGVRCFVLVSKENKIGYIYEHSPRNYTFKNFTLPANFKIVRNVVNFYNKDISLFILVHKLDSQPQSLPTCRLIYYVPLTTDPFHLQQYDNLQFCVESFTIFQNVIFYTKLILNSEKQLYYLCVSFLQTSVQYKDYCQLVSTLISEKYYLDDIVTYHELYMLRFFESDRNITLNLLLVSPSNQGFPIDLQLSTIRGNPNTSIWSTSGCYVGLYDKNIKIKNLIKVGYEVQQENQDIKNMKYLLLQFQNSDSDFIAFYQYSKITASYPLCSQITNVIANKTTQNSPQYGTAILNNNIVYRFTDTYQLHEKVYFVLNYEKPPPVTYVVIYGNNSNTLNDSQILGFYSKFIYQQEDIQPILNMSICFGVVIGLLILMRILREMCDRGVIKWKSTNSSDDDDLVTTTGTLSKYFLSD